ncbi:hypothetical protein CEE69_19205 [Rhodopirellula bahusiensis]|uniref:Uncharacterized protein n=1 Tax=Rhodopirellula bahusiensis TaxID=2014065 RepID=A0A2G1W4E8_9BACT|nr:hypothetical protein CEE69_19205 [Rhodopirellula bahusiensis]
MPAGYVEKAVGHSMKKRGFKTRQRGKNPFASFLADTSGYQEPRANAKLQHKNFRPAHPSFTLRKGRAERGRTKMPQSEYHQPTSFEPNAFWLPTWSG